MALRAEKRNLQPHEPTLAPRILGRRALHGREHACGLHEVTARRNEISERGEGARYDQIE